MAQRPTMTCSQVVRSEVRLAKGYCQCQTLVVICNALNVLRWKMEGLIISLKTYKLFSYKTHKPHWIFIIHTYLWNEFYSLMINIKKNNNHIQDTLILPELGEVIHSTSIRSSRLQLYLSKQVGCISLKPGFIVSYACFSLQKVL